MNKTITILIPSSGSILLATLIIGIGLLLFCLTAIAALRLQIPIAQSYYKKALAAHAAEAGYEYACAYLVQHYQKHTVQPFDKAWTEKLNDSHNAYHWQTRMLIAPAQESIISVIDASGQLNLNAQTEKNKQAFAHMLISLNGIGNDLAAGIMKHAVPEKRFQHTLQLKKIAYLGPARYTYIRDGLSVIKTVASPSININAASLSLLTAYFEALPVSTAVFHTKVQRLARDIIAYIHQKPAQQFIDYSSLHYFLNTRSYLNNEEKNSLINTLFPSEKEYTDHFSIRFSPTGIFNIATTGIANTPTEGHAAEHRLHTVVRLFEPIIYRCILSPHQQIIDSPIIQLPTPARLGTITWYDITPRHADNKKDDYTLSIKVDLFGKSSTQLSASSGYLSRPQSIHHLGSASAVQFHAMIKYASAPVAPKGAVTVLVECTLFDIQRLMEYTIDS